MTNSEYTNTPPNMRSSSTKWAWRQVIVTTGAEGKGQGEVRARSRRLESRDGRKPITVEITFEGGNTARYRVRARGRTWHFSGVTALHDVMNAINRTLDRTGDP